MAKKKNDSSLRAANESINRDLFPGEKEVIQERIAKAWKEILEAMGIDHAHDHNTKDTPKRVAKMFTDDLFVGLFSPPPAVTEFDNAQKYDQLITVGPIEIKSYCAHHFLPFIGYCIISVLPNPKSGRLLGLSKYSRIAQYYARRPQIQEELTRQITDHLWKILKPEGLGVKITSKHFCASIRGVNETNMLMTTTDLRGELLNESVKQEFIDECNTRASLYRW